MKEFGKLTDKEFKELEAKHGDVFTLEVPFEIPERTKQYEKLCSDFDDAELDGKPTKELEKAVKELEKETFVVLFGYLKKPDRSTISMALANQDRDPLRAKEIILAKSWLAGDDRIKTDDDAFYSASSVLDVFYQVRSASLKKN